MHLTLSVPNNFNFWRTVYSHGWCSLPPFRVIKERRRLRMAIGVLPGKALAIEVMQPSWGRLTIAIHSRKGFTPNERKNIVS